MRKLIVTASDKEKESPDEQSHIALEKSVSGVKMNRCRNRNAQLRWSSVQPKLSRPTSRIVSSAVYYSMRQFSLLNRHKRTVHCESATHGFEVLARFADILDDGFAKETRANVTEHAHKKENHTASNRCHRYLIECVSVFSLVRCRA